MAVEDAHGLDAFSLGNIQCSPTVVLLVAIKGGRLVKRRGVETTAKLDKSADGLGAIEATAVRPGSSPFIAKNPAAQVRILRFGKRRSGN